MAELANGSQVAPIPKMMWPHPLLRPDDMHTNSNVHTFPPYYYGVGSPADLNVTYLHELFYNDYNNYTFYDQKVCPSIQMPVGNLISMILFALVCIVGLFGNTLVIYAVLRFTKMKTVTNMYILNLAIADECFLIGIPFLIITMHLGEWTFGKAMCKAFMVSTSITQFTSSIFLFIMSADRYVAICHPVSATRYRSPFVAKIVSAAAWTMSAIIMLPVMFYATTIEKMDNQMTCNIQWPQENEAGSGTTFTLYSLILGFAIPLCLILTFYSMVLRKLRSVGSKTRSKEKKRSHRKVTKLVLTVITVYVLCWLPYWISQVALITSPPYVCNTRLQITLFVLVGCLGYSNSAMNPILYAFLSDNFKKSFLKAFTCTAGKDFNTQLQLENSFFTRFGKRSSEKFRSATKTGTAVDPTNVTTHASNNNLAASTAADRPNQTTCIINFNYKSVSDTSKSPQIESKNLDTNSIRSESFNLFTLNDRPPVLHTDL